MNTVDQGRGELFSNPDPDKLRSHFKSKNRKMVNKVMNLNDAVSKFVHDEEYIATGSSAPTACPLPPAMKSSARAERTWALPAIPPPMTCRF